ncbi:MAG: acetoin utilization protein AcuB [Arcticibacterium sp.]|jgi:acetoin utilization protein AcuB
MFAEDFIEHDLPAVDISDNVGLALQYMGEENLSQLLVLDGKTILGIIEEDILLNFDENSSLSLVPIKHDKAQVSAQTHFLQVADFLVNNNLEVCAVLNAEGKLLGCLKAMDVFKTVIKGQFSGKGGIFSLDIGQKDYSLSDVSRIIETEGLRIEKLFLASQTEEESYQFIIKLNKPDINPALNSLKRFGYRVEQISETTPDNFPDKERFDHLMKYLEI